MIARGADDTRLCVVCGQETRGSIGASGMIWRAICQPCKDRDDSREETLMRNTKESVDRLFAAMTGEERFDAYEQKATADDLARRERVGSENTKADPIVVAPAPRLVRE